MNDLLGTCAKKLLRAALGLSVAMLLTVACRPATREVVVYCALDREFAEPILRQFELETGVRVLAKYDVESTKTVGLANAILAERAHPRCDLFWNNEILHTLRLKQAGVLAPWQPTEVEQFAKQYCDPEGQWFGLAARARVIIVNTDLVKKDDQPTSLSDLVNERWRGRVGIAKPLFGTTATHAAVLFSEWGEKAATKFFQDFKANGGRILSGNKQVAQAVASGQIAWGITDTDDAMGELETARPVAIIFPDQTPGEGALLIPNSICVIKNSRHPNEAKQLADYILTAHTEGALSRGASAQIPVLRETSEKPRILSDKEYVWRTTDFERAAEKWTTTAEVLTKLFTVD